MVQVWISDRIWNPAIWRGCEQMQQVLTQQTYDWQKWREANSGGAAFETLTYTLQT
jgi:hypothetical protein